MWMMRRNQECKHSDGYIVAGKDRFTITYTDDDLRAEVEVEHGMGVTYVYRESLVFSKPVSGPAYRELILVRMTSGIQFLMEGERVEVC